MSSLNSKKSHGSSLTPQRKHRKLLKDGSGTEVWPESIEKIFVQGLRQYWDSPWATYSQARGRSRWRNQFLVDYLQKAGIDRTKKQVASHIQVLRNMWKGEPEFYLVAGGEESLSDPGLSPVKLEDRYDTSTLLPLDFDESDGLSSASVSPDFSPPDFQQDFPPSPGLFNTNHIAAPQTLAPKSPLDTSSYASNGVFTTSLPSSLSIYPVDTAARQSQEYLPLQNHYPLDTYTSTLGQSISSQGIDPYGGTHTHRVPDSTHLAPQQYSHNRATAMCLLADGMTPFSIKLDALVPAQPAQLALKIKLCITPVDDIRSPSTLHGFSGTISLAQVWANSGKCITRVYADNRCISEEIGVLEISNVEMGTAHAMLPDSSLSRCRWFDTSVHTSIIQEIIVDNETLILLIYDLDRANKSAMPSAELLGYQSRKTTPKTFHQHNTSTYQYPVTSSMGYPSLPYPQQITHTSLSCALTPRNSLRQPVATS